MKFEAVVRWDGPATKMRDTVEFTEPSRAAALAHVEKLKNEGMEVDRLRRVIPIKL